MDQHRNLILSIASGLGSISNFIIAFATKSNIAWAIGVIAGIYSIYCSHLTHKEKKLNIKKLEKELK